MTGAEKPERGTAAKKPFDRSIRTFYFDKQSSGGVDPSLSDMKGHPEIVAEDRRYRVLLVDLVGAPLLMRDEVKQRHILMGAAPDPSVAAASMERFAGSIVRKRSRIYRGTLSSVTAGGITRRFNYLESDRWTISRFDPGFDEWLYLTPAFDFTVEQDELRRAEVVKRLTGEPLAFVKERAKQVLQRLRREPEVEPVTMTSNVRILIDGLRRRPVA